MWRPVSKRTGNRWTRRSGTDPFLFGDSSVVIKAERLGKTAYQMVDGLGLGDTEMAVSVVTVLELAHGVVRADTETRRAARQRFLDDLIAQGEVMLRDRGCRTPATRFSCEASPSIACVAWYSTTQGSPPPGQVLRLELFELPPPASEKYRGVGRPAQWSACLSGDDTSGASSRPD